LQTAKSTLVPSRRPHAIVMSHTVRMRHRPHGGPVS